MLCIGNSCLGSGASLRDTRMAVMSAAMSIGFGMKSSNTCRASGSTSVALIAITGMTLKRRYSA